MDERAAWERAAASALSRYSALPAADRAELGTLLEKIMGLKQQLVDLATAAGSSAVCRSCGGECCLLGKYHFSVLDLLSYRHSGTELFSPDFSAAPTCPYSDAAGCLMPPRHRPMTCVIFNCQLIEELLSPDDRETLHGYENRLRAAVTRAGRIGSTRLDRPLLLSCS